MSKITDIRDSAIKKFTVPLLTKVVIGLLLIITGQFIHTKILSAELGKAIAEKASVEQLYGQAVGVANDNHRSNLFIADQLKQCSVENVRVRTDGENAVAQKDREIASIVRDRDSWEKRFKVARKNKLCDELLNRSIADVCPGIKDF